MQPKKKKLGSGADWMVQFEYCFLAPVMNSTQPPATQIPEVPGHLHLHTYTRTHAHTLTYTHAYSHTHTRKRTFMNTPTCTHSHAHTHSDTYTS